MLGLYALSAAALSVVSTGGAVAATPALTCRSTVTVANTQAVVSTVSLSPAGLTITPSGGTATMTATAYSSLGVALSGKTFSAQSSDTDKVTVSVAGSVVTVTGVNLGSANITAIADGVSSDTSTVSVTIGFFVSTTGSASNTGTFSSPWTYAFAASGGGGLVVPGSTVWLRAGDYTGAVPDITVAGTAALPIVFRNYNNERATVRSTKDIQIASYVWWWGIEVRNPASSVRISTQTTGDLSQASDVTHGSLKPSSSSASGIKIINTVIHDVWQGPFAGNGSPGFEMSGCLLYNIGWEGTDRGHGHALYSQNQGPTIQYLKDNVCYGSFDYLVNLDGTGSSYINYLWLEGNALFHSSDVCKTPPRVARPLTTISNVPGHIQNLTFRTNSWYTYEVAAQFDFGNAAWEVDDLEYTGNISQGIVGFMAVKRLVSNNNKMTRIPAVDNTFRHVQNIRLIIGVNLATHADTIDNNAYAWISNATYKGLMLTDDAGHATLYDLAGWQAATGFDTNSTYTNATVFATADIVYRQNAYDGTKCWVHCWNWQNLATLNISLTSCGLFAGDAYEIRHVYDYFGSAVASGTYDGSTPVAVGQTGYTYPTPQDYANYPGVTSASPRFNVFEVKKV